MSILWYLRIASRALEPGDIKVRGYELKEILDQRLARPSHGFLSLWTNKYLFGKDFSGEDVFIAWCSILSAQPSDIYDPLNQLIAE